MRRASRVLVEAGGSFLLLHFLACLPVAAGRVDYGVPVEIKLWDSGRTPLAHMVDVTNGFGLKVLAEHNFLNDNNIAFSPYGLMGIMVALYEGVDGESSYQIQRGMQLPWNRNVMRIGFRDIHRTLKTYFVPEEGFLAGLALNNENVTFNDSYKKILRFYGFDLENDQLPTLPSSSSNTNETTLGPTTSISADTMTTTAMTTENNPTGSTTAPMTEETTTNPNAETIDVDVRAPTEATTARSSLAPNAESTIIMPTTSTTDPGTTIVAETTTDTITEAVTTTAIASSTVTTAPSTTTTALSTTTAAPSTNTPAASEADTTMTTAGTPSAEADAETIAQQTSQATSALTVQPTANNEIATTADMGSSTTESTSVASTVTGTNDMTESVMMTTSPMSDTPTPTDGSTTLTDITTSADLSTTVNESTLETLQRRKKSIVDFIFTNPPYVDDYFFYRSYQVGPEMPIPGFDDKMFLANGLKSVQVTYMHYETVLEHAFLPHLEASALRLPLDSDRYYLLVVLPNRGGSAELGRLLARMARESDLADVYAALRPRRVRAVVPSFIVKGHVILTTDLQKLGIRDVFEPRQRDFTPMTRQAGVYVRSIEQAVSVAIRKYRPDDHKKNRYVNNRDPVTFSATYPFLYFVMDATIHVALMAGKMVDPLNSRIL